MYTHFCQKPHAVLLATDVAARGLDFTGVEWVVQADCPEDVATYIHRTGRTARYTAKGRALLMLLPSEAPMVNLLQQARIPLRKLSTNASALPAGEGMSPHESRMPLPLQPGDGDGVT